MNHNVIVLFNVLWLSLRYQPLVDNICINCK